MKKPEIVIRTKEDYEHYAKCDKPIVECIICSKVWGYLSEYDFINKRLEK